ncbi:RNA polymerase sigma-70 factor [Mucilaginibacter boryungensis]|uniref:RNA polymerase sigma-70 factor n=1 Tax=Mucilaginibacter boryungensis TaxID=768480 RepID=A0ABR9XHA5_9SPHI|nr:RNA polymerase sigma-70 factor [Mucilaginibacter boryungensis]MBE9666773.1 RNA polymerase sigma-70 factor [Mucilaginibacter boryungensis]
MANKRHVSSDENELLKMLSNGSQEAFALIYNKYSEKLLMYVGKVIKDEVAAQDIVQDLFITVWQRRLEMEKVESLGAYLTTSARYKAFTYIRNNLYKQNFAASISAYLESYDNSLQETLQARELETLIDQEIERLPERMRAVYIMSRKEHFSHKEIAEKLNIADTTVKKQIGKVLKQFKLRLDKLYSMLL